MKQLLILLAATGLLYSCSKETPAPPVVPNVDNQETALEPPVFLDQKPGGSKGVVSLSFTAELDQLEDAKVDLDGKPQPESRGVDAGFKRNNKPLELLLKEDATGSGKVRGLLVLTDGNNANTSRIWTDFTITDGGKGISFDREFPRDLSPNLNRLIDKNFAGVKLTVIIGAQSEGNNVVFKNKGARLSTGNSSYSLPNDYVLLKSAPVALVATPGHPRLSANNIKLRMQGYMLAVHIRNLFPEKVVRYSWKAPYTDANIKMLDKHDNPIPNSQVANASFAKRPPLKARFNIRGLSALYQQSVSVDAAGQVSVTSGDILTSRFPKSPYKRKRATDVRYNPMDIGGTGEFLIPVSTGAARTDVDPKNFYDGEPVVLLYCPNSADRGAFGYEPAELYFYDDSYLSAMVGTRGAGGLKRFYYVIQYVDNIVVKTKNSVEGKIYPILLNLRPYPAHTAATPAGKAYWTFRKDYYGDKLTQAEANQAVGEEYARRLGNLVRVP